MASKSTIYYRNNPEANKKKIEYNKKYQKEHDKATVKSKITGKTIKYKSDLKNEERKAKAKGQDTSKTDYDHTTGKRIDRSKNRGNKKSFMFAVKGKKGKAKLKVKKKS